MMFDDLFVDELRDYIGEIIEIAVNDGLFEGRIRSITDGVIEFIEIITGFEEEMRQVFIPLESVNFVRVPL